MRQALAIFSACVLASCVGFARHEYISSTPAALNAEIAHQKDVIAALGSGGDGNLIYELYSRHGLMVCLADGRELNFRSVELNAEGLCGPGPMMRLRPDGWQAREANEIVCVSPDDIVEFGSPYKSYTFGYYPNMTDETHCPE